MPYRDPSRPPSLRDGACPKCLAEDVVYVPRPVERSGDYNHVYHRSLVRLDDHKRVGGEEEAFFCRSCGFVEFYLRAPKQVPVDGVHAIPWRRGADGQVFVPRVAVVVESFWQRRREKMASVLVEHAGLSRREAIDRIGEPPARVAWFAAERMVEAEALAKELRGLGCEVRLAPDGP